MVNSYYRNQNEYIPKSQASAETGYVLAGVLSSAIMGTLPFFTKPFERQLMNEHQQNYLYKDAFEHSLKQSGLADKGVEVIPAQMLRNNSAECLGKNAYYAPKTNKIMINTDKISIAGFHEAGHAHNALFGGIGKFLSKLRWPCRAIAGWMGTIALFSTPKPKDEPRNFRDKVKDNCGKIAFVSMLPTVFEEGLASYKGIKMAKQTGLSDSLLKNMKKLYGKALLTYVGHAVATGLAVGCANMVMQKFTRPKKVEREEFIQQ